mmetsp:Transcript_24573/g.79035  ORF Transcript_24573/g.79035 Transcript_24573/m.79035 type:complete len:229 (+) Transcript_24573:1072-1758(+)
MAWSCIACRVSSSSRHDGDSSITFWLRRWMEHSRSGKATTLPCLSPSTWISMWRGSSTNFSMKMRSSPNALLASFLDRRKPSSASSSLYAMRMPLPPPPAEALIMTGYPISRATRSTSSSASTVPTNPGITFTLACMAIFLDSILSPMAVMALAFGPMKATPSSSSASAKSWFSDRKPYPGWTACEPVWRMTSMILGMLRYDSEEAAAPSRKASSAIWTCLARASGSE